MNSKSLKDLLTISDQILIGCQVNIFKETTAILITNLIDTYNDFNIMILIMTLLIMILITTLLIMILIMTFKMILIMT